MVENEPAEAVMEELRFRRRFSLLGHLAPDLEETQMLATSVRRLSIPAALVLGALSLSACATKAYVREQVAIVDARVTTVDAKASDALQRADAATSAAQAAAADARNANQRLDQLTPRVDTLEQRAASRRARN